MIEINRNENSKTYQLKGAKKRLVISVAPIHYKESYKKNEPWLDIDHTHKVDDGDYWFYDRMPIKLRIKKDNTVYEVESRRNQNKITVELISNKTGLDLNLVVKKHGRGVELWQEADDDRTVKWRVKTTGQGNLSFREDPKALRVNDAFPEGEEIHVVTRKVPVRAGEFIWEADIKKGDKVDPTVDESVPSGADDGQLFAGSYEQTSQQIQSGDDSGKGGNNLWIRFTSVAIPVDATISQAILTYIAHDTASNNAVLTDLFFNDEDNASAPTNATDYNNKSVTAASVAWDNIVSTTQGNSYNSPDIKTPLQEVIDRGGWASGNAIMILHKDGGSTGSASRKWAAFEHATLAPPAISIDYTEAGGASSIKTVSTIAQASVKTINGINIADIKTVDTISNVS